MCGLPFNSKQMGCAEPYIAIESPLVASHWSAVKLVVGLASSSNLLWMARKQSLQTQIL